MANLIANFQEIYKNIGSSKVDDDDKESSGANGAAVDHGERDKQLLGDKDPNVLPESTKVRAAQKK